MSTLAIPRKEDTEREIGRKTAGQPHVFCPYTLPKAVAVHRLAMEKIRAIQELVFEIRQLGYEADNLGAHGMETAMVNFQTSMDEVIDDDFDCEWAEFKELIDSFPGEAS